MKDLKITPGEAVALTHMADFNSKGGYTVKVVAYGRTCLALGETREEAEANATLYADAHNTYQSTGMTASELAADRDFWKHSCGLANDRLDVVEKQRDELLEALKEIIDSAPTEGSLKYEQSYVKAFSLLKTLK